MQIFCKFVLPKMGHSFRVLLGLCAIFPQVAPTYGY